MLSPDWFERPRVLDQIHDDLIERIATSGRPAGEVEALRERARVAELVGARRLVAIPITLGLIVAALIAQSLSGPFDTPHVLWQGATAPWLTEPGDAYRMLSGAVLHGGLMHAAVNLGLIALVGPMVERLLGGARTVIVMVVSALAGTTAIVLLADRSGAGASGAAYGLVAALLVLNGTDRRGLPAPYTVSPIPLMIGLATVALVEWTRPQSGTSAHLAAAAAGSLTCLVLRRGWTIAAPTASASVLVRGLAVVLAATVGVSVAAAVLAAARSSPSAITLRTALALAETRPESPAFEAYTYLLTGLEDVRRADLERVWPTLVARTDPESGVFVWVRARVAYMLGDVEGALDDSARAAHGSADASLLAAHALLRLEALRAGVVEPASLGAELHLDPTGRATVQVDEAPAEGLVVDVLLLDGAIPVALVRLVAGTDTRRRFESVDGFVADDVELGAVTPIVVERRARQPGDYPTVEPGQVAWWYRPIDPDEALRPRKLSD